MTRSWLLQRLEAYGDREALISDGWRCDYAGLVAAIDRWRVSLHRADIGAGQVIAFDGDYSEQTVPLLLALFEHGCIAVPLASASPAQKPEFLATASADFLVDCRVEGAPTITALAAPSRHKLIDSLSETGRPGLVLFSSGSTGRAKAMLHDADRLLEKFRTPRRSSRILTFLLLDHIGGINTLLSGLASGGAVVNVLDRKPQAVCRAIERHRVEILPTTPTFLNLLLLSGAYRDCDLSSLRLITYGTEVMQASTLSRLGEAFPGVRFQQTYGLSELGILSSKSREDGSLWVKVGGDGYETKIIDGVLWVRARSAMLGYLNAESKFDSEGWFNTQDAVEQDGEWLRFLGRTSDIINVGGQKVYPAEVESVLLQLDNVLDVTVQGERNPLLGQCVVAHVKMRQPEALVEFTARMRKHCQGRLARYMVPVKVKFVDAELHNARGKRVRENGRMDPNSLVMTCRV